MPNPEITPPYAHSLWRTGHNATVAQFYTFLLQPSGHSTVSQQQFRHCQTEKKSTTVQALSNRKKSTTVQALSDRKKFTTVQAHCQTESHLQFRHTVRKFLTTVRAHCQTERQLQFRNCQKNSLHLKHCQKKSTSSHTVRKN